MRESSPASRRRRVSAVASCLAIAASLGGCGSYTRAQFTARADAICTASTRALRSLPAPAASASPAYLMAVATTVEREARELRHLPRPAQSRRRAAELGAYLAAVQQAAANFNAAAAAAASGNSGQLRRAESVLARSPVQSRAVAYGLRTCAGPGATTGSSVY